MSAAPFPVVASLQPLVDRGELAGAVTLIADHDRILQIDTVGYADRAAQKPMREDTLFWIASTTKPITATAVMMLVDEGKIRLDAPVEEYLPDFAGQQVIIEKTDDRVVLGKPSHPITIHEILSHTSGLPFVSRVEKLIDARTLQEAAVSYAMSPLQFQPGTAYLYTNSGINTAGRIVEVISGQSYESFLQERLFDPLGMTETSFLLSTEQLPRLAKTYRTSPDKTHLVEAPIRPLTYPLDGPGRYPCPGGGLFSVGKDVAAFGQMLLGRGTFRGRQFLSKESFDRMTTIHTGSFLFQDGVEKGYGYGMEIVPPAGTTGQLTGEYGHGGAYSNKLWIDPIAGRVMVFLVQHAEWVGEKGNTAWPAFKALASQNELVPISVN